jgi:hypothetical protein
MSAATPPTYDAELLDALARVFAEAALERLLEEMKQTEDKEKASNMEAGTARRAP